MRYPEKLRPSRPSDDEFLFHVFRSARQGEFGALDIVPEQLEQILKAQFDAQCQQYRTQYADAHFDIVLVGDEPAGNLYAQRGPEKFVLIDITLLPEYRDSGLGARLVQALVNDAQAANCPVHALVRHGNRAWRLWQRLGFRQVGDDGVYLHIEVPADTAT